MIRNPFRFGREVGGDQFYDREAVYSRLRRILANGSPNVVMYAPRRYGKTSLVKKVLAACNAEGVPTVYFDMNRVENIERFCEEYVTALCALKGIGSELTQKLLVYLSHLHPVIGAGGGTLVSVKFDYGGKMTANSVSAVLEWAEKVAVELGEKPLVVAFDEFQEIGRLSGELPL